MSSESDSMDQPYWHIDRSAAFVVAISCLASFLAIAVWMAGGDSRHFDEAGIAILRSATRSGLIGPEWMAEAVRDITALGGVFLRNLFAIAAIAVLVTLGFRRQAAALFVTVAGGWALSVTLKTIFMRERPGSLPHLMEASGFSFPSGHSFNAAVVYVGMALIFAGFSQRPAVRTTIIAAAIVLSFAIGISRVALGVHYPTDVIAGLAGGAGWVCLCMVLFRRPQFR
jgi:undecaprenyl-diphosphatase